MASELLLRFARVLRGRGGGHLLLRLHWLRRSLGGRCFVALFDFGSGLRLLLRLDKSRCLRLPLANFWRPRQAQLYVPRLSGPVASEVDLWAAMVPP